MSGGRTQGPTLRREELEGQPSRLAKPSGGGNQEAMRGREEGVTKGEEGTDRAACRGREEGVTKPPSQRRSGSGVTKPLTAARRGTSTAPLLQLSQCDTSTPVPSSSHLPTDLSPPPSRRIFQPATPPPPAEVYVGRWDDQPVAIKVLKQRFMVRGLSSQRCATTHDTHTPTNLTPANLPRHQSDPSHVDVDSHTTLTAANPPLPGVRAVARRLRLPHNCSQPQESEKAARRLRLRHNPN